MTHSPGRAALWQAAMAFAGMAAFPRLAYRLRWPTRLGPRGFVAYVAFNTLVLFAMRMWVIPYFRRMMEEHELADEAAACPSGPSPA